MTTQPSTATPAPDSRERGGGAVSVPVAVLLLALLAVAGLAVDGARKAQHIATADAIAEEAARAGAQAIDPAAAAQGVARLDPATARAAAQHYLDTATTDHALSGTVTVDTPRVAAAPEQTALVRAQVTCAVRWSDLALPGTPGTRTVTATFTSPIDRFRERAP